MDMTAKPPKTVSCDVCRLRKTKCDRPRYRNDPPPLTPTPPCTSCVEQKIPCTFNYVPQKPGPQPGRKRKSDADTNGHNGVLRLSPRSTATTPRALDIQALVDPFNGESSSSSAQPLSNTFLSSPLIPREQLHHLPFLPSEPASRIDNPLDKLVPRADLSHIIDIYFGYIFCLTPFPHPPSFLADLYNRREERPGEEEWTHMVLIMIASTLVQVPHQMLPHTVAEIRRIVIRCLDQTKQYLSKSYLTASINRNFTIYCAGLVEHNLGHDLSARELHGSNVSLVLQRELDREITYSTFSPFDREMQSRVWWLIYCGDRSAACCEGAKLLIDEENSSSVQLPNDDPRILEDPIPPFAEPPSILTGFRYISQAWRIAGQLLSRRNRDARKAPQGQEILTRLAEVEELLEQLEGLMEGCPSYLQLELAAEDSLSPLEKLLNLGNEPPGTMPKADAWSGMSIAQPKRQYIIQQANIYITQQCVRMMGLQYREQLQSLRYTERERNGQLVASSPAKRQREIAIYREEQFAVLSYLLRILHSLPHELIAVNSLPGVTKIRYVAASLLAELEANPVNEDHNDVAHQRAVDYLSQYLTILAKIENLFSLAA